LIFSFVRGLLERTRQEISKKNKNSPYYNVAIDMPKRVPKSSDVQCGIIYSAELNLRY